MKNWKLLAVFSLIAVLFVFAGCIAGTTTPEETPTAVPTVAPTEAPTATPAELNVPIEITNFLDGVVDDGYLNIAEASADKKIEGTAPAGSEITVYVVPLAKGEEKISATAVADSNGNWWVTIVAAELQKLNDGNYEIYAGYGNDPTKKSNSIEFTVDYTAPTLKDSIGYAGNDYVAQVDAGVSVVPITPLTTTNNVISGTPTIVSPGCPTEGGKWEFQVEDLNNDNAADVVIRNVDTNEVLQIFNIAGSSDRIITLPGSSITVSVDFVNTPVDQAVDRLEITPCTPEVPGEPGYVNVNFSENVTVASWSSWVYGPGAVTFNSVVSNEDIRPWPLTDARSSWWFEEAGTPTVCDLGYQYSFVFPASDVVDVAGNPADTDLDTQGVFINP